MSCQVSYVISINNKNMTTLKIKKHVIENDKIIHILIKSNFLEISLLKGFEVHSVLKYKPPMRVDFNCMRLLQKEII